MCFLRTVDAPGGNLVNVVFAPLKSEAHLLALASAGGDAGGAAAGAGDGHDGHGGGGGDAAAAAAIAPGTTARGTVAVPGAGAAAVVLPVATTGGGLSGGGPPRAYGSLVTSVPRPSCSAHTPIFTASTGSSCSSRGGGPAWDPLTELHGKTDGAVGSPVTVAPPAGCGGGAPAPHGWPAAVSTDDVGAADVEMMSDGEAAAAAVHAMDSHTAASSWVLPTPPVPPLVGARLVSPAEPTTPAPALMPVPAVEPAPPSAAWLVPALAPRHTAWVPPPPTWAPPPPDAPDGGNASAPESAPESAPDARVDTAHASRLASVRVSLAGSRPHRRGRRRVHPKAPDVVAAELSTLGEVSVNLGRLAADVTARRGALQAKHDRLVQKRSQLGGGDGQ